MNPLLQRAYGVYISFPDTRFTAVNRGVVYVEKSGGVWYNNKNKQRVLVYGK